MTSVVLCRPGASSIAPGIPGPGASLQLSVRLDGRVWTVAGIEGGGRPGVVPGRG